MSNDLWPEKAPTDPVEYTCSICKKTYKSNPEMAGISCAVLHGPNSCCHYSDIEVTSSVKPPQDEPFMEFRGADKKIVGKIWEKTYDKGLYKMNPNDTELREQKSVHFSSLRMDWQTPDAIYKALDDEFHFDYDPAPPHYVIDSLDPQNEWGNINFVNPPYGRELPRWIEKGYQQWQLSKTVVFLIPSRTDTRWWHDYCMKASEIRFIKGRLKFKGAKWNAPFPSAVVVFRGAKKVKL